MEDVMIVLCISLRLLFARHAPLLDLQKNNICSDILGTPSSNLALASTCSLFELIQLSLTVRK
jgi:hypothetical protein